MESTRSSILRQVDTKHLHPKAEDVRRAKQRADLLIQELHEGNAWMYKVEEVIDHGSLSRGTGLGHFRDLDRLVVLNREHLRTIQQNDRSPRDTISRMTRSISARRAGLIAMDYLRVWSQDHSVGVYYPGSGIKLDLVPALRNGSGFLIPERTTDSWIATDPARTEQRLLAAFQRCKHIRIAIRLLKGWSRARGKLMPSYAIETFLVDRVLRGGAAPLDLLVQDFFRRIAAHDARGSVSLRGHSDAPVTVMDPVTGANLTEGVDHVRRRMLIAKSRDALRVLDELEEEVYGPGGTSPASARNLFVGRRYQ